MIILLNEKTDACLRHEPDSVKPEKSCLRVGSREVLNNLYPIVITKLNAYLTTSIFKHDLFQMKGFFKYFKQIHSTSPFINNKVFFEKLLFSQIIFDF
jgi:hypothetical protein